MTETLCQLCGKKKDGIFCSNEDCTLYFVEVSDTKLSSQIAAIRQKAKQDVFDDIQMGFHGEDCVVLNPTELKLFKKKHGVE